MNSRAMPCFLFNWKSSESECLFRYGVWPFCFNFHPFSRFDGLVYYTRKFTELCSQHYSNWQENKQTNRQYLHSILCWNFCFPKPGFSNTWTMNFLMFKLVLEKEEEPEIKLPISAGSWKKQESSRKALVSALLTMPKPLTVWITINCGKFWKRWEY